MHSEAMQLTYELIIFIYVKNNLNTCILPKLINIFDIFMLHLASTMWIGHQMSVKENITRLSNNNK